MIVLQRIAACGAPWIVIGHRVFLAVPAMLVCMTLPSLTRQADDRRARDNFARVVNVLVQLARQPMPLRI
jgi:hypothetical protein